MVEHVMADVAPDRKIMSRLEEDLLVTNKSLRKALEMIIKETNSPDSLKLCGNIVRIGEAALSIKVVGAN